MIDRLVFVVPGRPQAKQRPRTVRAGAGVRTYTPDETIAYEGLVRWCALGAVAQTGWVAGDDLFKVSIQFVYPAPKSAKESRYKASRPDIDNLSKSVMDGLGRCGVIGDDSRVVKLLAEKVSVIDCEHANGYAIVAILRIQRTDKPYLFDNNKRIEEKGNK